jgi:hypothetical protein
MEPVLVEYEVSTRPDAMACAEPAATNCCWKKFPVDAVKT